jgi:3-methyladenine DNA glycosylase AlkD
MTAAEVVQAARAEGDPERATFLQTFFRTGPGEYGEGDAFLGLRVPQSRKLARRFRDLDLDEYQALLDSDFHEVRLIGLLIMVDAYARAQKLGPEGEAARDDIFTLYLANTHRVNSWDLVDSSAHRIVGPHLYGADTGLLDELARSESLWERRIAMLATAHFIAQGEFEPTLRVAEILVDDDHDLIHKAVGWMLREVGKRDVEAEEAFLVRHYRTMPRTMLRYAIEKFPEPRRQAWLKGEID